MCPATDRRFPPGLERSGPRASTSSVPPARPALRPTDVDVRAGSSGRRERRRLRRLDAGGPSVDPRESFRPAAVEQGHGIMAQVRSDHHSGCEEPVSWSRRDLDVVRDAEAAERRFQGLDRGQWYAGRWCRSAARQIVIQVANTAPGCGPWYSRAPHAAIAEVWRGNRQSPPPLIGRAPFRCAASSSLKSVVVGSSA